MPGSADRRRVPGHLRRRRSCRWSCGSARSTASSGSRSSGSCSASLVGARRLVVTELPRATSETLLDAIVGGGAFLLFPVSIGVAVLRFHLYDLDVVVRKALVYGALRAVRHAGLPRARGRASGVWLGRDNSFLTMVAAVVVALTFQPVRARLARFANRVVYGKRATPVRGAVRVLRARRRRLRRRGRAAADGAGPRRGHRRRASRRVAGGRSGAARRRRLARRRRPHVRRSRCRTARSRRSTGVDRVYPVEQAGRAARRARGPQAGERPLSPGGREADRRPRRAGRARAPQRPAHRGARARLDDLQAAQKRLVSAQDEERAGSSATSTTARSSSSSRSRSSCGSPTT